MKYQLQYYSKPLLGVCFFNCFTDGIVGEEDRLCWCNILRPLAYFGTAAPL